MDTFVEILRAGGVTALYLAAAFGVYAAAEWLGAYQRNRRLAQYLAHTDRGWPPLRKPIPPPPHLPDKPQWLHEPDFNRQHAGHGGILDITRMDDDPPHMVRRLCECGVQHYGKREAT
jgi:hypothetical protein